MKLIDVLLLAHQEVNAHGHGLCLTHDIEVCRRYTKTYTAMECRNCPLQNTQIPSGYHNLPHLHILDEMTGREP